MGEMVSIADLRERKKREGYAKLVVRAWDDAEHGDKKTQRDAAAKINQQNREKL